MLEINDIILYGAAGACQVKDFCKKQSAGEEHDYAVLETQTPPKTTIYLPLENETLLGRIRAVLPADQLLAIIHDTTPSDSITQGEDEGAKRRNYREILTDCEPAGLVGLIKALVLRQKEQRSIGKKLHSTDEKTLKEAQRLLYNEISYVMQIPPEEAPGLLTRELEGE